MGNLNRGLWSVIKRGLLCRCPGCGVGTLYEGYVKQVDSCASCGENLNELRADDGPAWLTILIVGHLIAPLIIVMSKHSGWSYGVLMSFLILLVLALVALILPRAKGFFIAMLWRMKEGKNS